MKHGKTGQQADQKENNPYRQFFTHSHRFQPKEDHTRGGSIEQQPGKPQGYPQQFAYNFRRPGYVSGQIGKEHQCHYHEKGQCQHFFIFSLKQISGKDFNNLRASAALYGQLRYHHMKDEACQKSGCQNEKAHETSIPLGKIRHCHHSPADSITGNNTGAFHDSQLFVFHFLSLRILL